MKMTLLQMVQGILSSLNSDEVNSITDTTESLQVANVIQDTYNSLVALINFPESGTVINLNSSGNTAKPTLMTLPSNVENLQFVKYNKILDDGIDVWENVDYVPLQEFLNLNYMLASVTDGTVHSYTVSQNGMSIKVYYRNDKNPDWFTSLDDTILLFDSYYATNDTTLQSVKTLANGKYSYAFTMSDSFTPHLDSNQFALLYNQAKEQAFIEMKEVANPHAAKRAKNHLIQAAKTKYDMPGTSYGSRFDGLPDYGRKGSGYGLSSRVMRSGR